MRHIARQPRRGGCCALPSAQHPPAGGENMPLLWLCRPRGRIFRGIRPPRNIRPYEAGRARPARSETKHCATLALLLLLLPAAPSFAVGPPTVLDLYDWTNLPSVGGPVVQESTNTRGPDAGRLKDASPGQCVLLEAQGPGCILRLSVMSVAGRVKVYLDGAEAPQIDVKAEDLHPLYTFWEFWDAKKFASFDQDHPQVFPFLAPLCARAPGWQNWSMIPIVFARSAKVVWEHDPSTVWARYSVLWSGLPAGDRYRSYSAQAMQEQEAQVWEAAQAWRQPGRRPYRYPDEKPESGQLALPAGATAELWKGTGAGTIVSLRLKATQWNRAVDRLLVLQAYWDGETRPSVECPLGDLCTSEAGQPNSHALAAGRGKDGWYYFYLPMPYANGARLTLHNYSRHEVPSLEWEIVTRPGAPAADAGRFCARFKRDQRVDDDGVYEMLAATGAGKIVGFNIYVDGFQVPMKEWKRPGRMAFYADGEAEPSLAGAALLMYWYEGSYGGPNSAPPLMATPHFEYATFGNFGSYRMFLTDAPTWTQSGRLAMEVEMDEVSGGDFTSVVWWYRTPEGTDNLPALQAEDLVLPVRHDPGSLEAEDLVKTAKLSQGDLLVVDDSDGRYGVGNNAFVSYAPLGTGDSVTFTVPVEKAGRYILGARLVTGPSGGFWGVSVNGSSIDSRQDAWGCFNDETTVAWWAGFRNVGEFDFRAGDNQVTFVSRRAYVGARSRGMLLGLDALTLTPPPPSQ